MHTEKTQQPETDHEKPTIQESSPFPSLAQSQPPRLMGSHENAVRGDLRIKDSAKSEPCNTLLEGLLKSPLWVIQQIELDRGWWRRGGFLLVWGLVFHAFYGAAIGIFGGWEAAAMSAVKSPLIALCSLGLCLPSLYIFSCLGGMRITLSQTFALASCILAIIGLLLLGLTPVAWLFSASTNNIVFTAVFGIFAWLAAVGFALRFLLQMSLSETFRSVIGLKWWLLIFILVSFQMATTMRPLIETPKTGWWTAEKKFFGTHFLESIHPNQQERHEK